MAHRAHLFLALAAILIVGAAANGSKPNTVAPVCRAVKNAGKNAGTCATFQTGVCDSVKSDDCDRECRKKGLPFSGGKGLSFGKGKGLSENTPPNTLPRPAPEIAAKPPRLLAAAARIEVL
jgi:hypothetical protein